MLVVSLWGVKGGFWSHLEKVSQPRPQGFSLKKMGGKSPGDEVESHYICPFRYRLVLCIKKFTKNALTLTTQKSPLGVSSSLSHTHIGFLQGFNLNFPTKILVSFIWESPLGKRTFRN